MLLKIHNNFFQYFPEKDRFISYAPSTMPYSIGSWFKCKEEEIHFLRKEILAGKFKIKFKIPGIEKRFS